MFLLYLVYAFPITNPFFHHFSRISEQSNEILGTGKYVNESGEELVREVTQDLLFMEISVYGNAVEFG